MRVGILGYYGQGNLGDDAVLEGLLKALERASPRATPIVYSLHPEAVLLPDYAEVRRARIFNFPAMLKSVGEIDCVLIGGGGVLHDYSLDAPTRYLLWALAARVRRRRVMLAALGVGPVATRLGAAQIKATASLADLITVRDNPSAQWLRFAGVKKPIEVLADPALIACSRPTERQQTSPAPAVFALRPWPPLSAGNEDLARSLAMAADAVVRRLDARALLMPFHTPGDDAFCAAVKTMMEEKDRAAIIARPTSAQQAIDMLAQASVLVSMRFHGLIFAAAAGIPMVALACDEKLSSLMAEIGQERFSLPLEGLDPENVSAACEGAIGDWIESAAKAKQRFESLQSRAARIEVHLSEFLARAARTLS